MRVLLDNCVHRRLKDLILGHDFKHTSECGLSNYENGDLLIEAAKVYDVLLTTDQNIRFQHNLAKLPLPVVEIDTRDTRIQALRVFAPFLLAAIDETTRFNFVSVKSDGRLETLAPRATQP